MSQDKSELFSLIKSPSQSASRLADYAERAQDQPGIIYPGAMGETVPKGKRYPPVNPLGPGQVESLIGVSGMGKTTFMLYRAIQAARLYRDTGQTDKAVVFISLEQSVEALEQYAQIDAPYSIDDMSWGQVGRADVARHVSERMTLPLYLGGWSQFDNQSKDKMTIRKIVESLKAMKDDFGVTPAHVVIDYLQVLHIEGNFQSRPKELEEAGHQVKDLAIEMDCSVSLGVQANPDTVNRKTLPVPGLGDTWYTRIVDMISAKVFGLTRPIRWDNRDEGEKISWGGNSYEITNDLMLLRMIKQRHSKVGYGEYAMYLDPDTMTLTDAPALGMSFAHANGSKAF